MGNVTDPEVMVGVPGYERPVEDSEKEARESVLKIAYHAAPFVAFMLVVALIIGYWPALSTILLPQGG